MTLEELRKRAAESPTLENLRALRAAVEAELRAMNTAAGDGDLDEAQTVRWNDLETEHTATVARIDTEERAERVRQSRAKWGSTQVGAKEQPFDGRDLRTLNRTELRSKAMAVLDSRDHTNHLGDVTIRDTPMDVSAVQGRVAKLLRTYTGDFDGAKLARLMLASETEAYRSAFMKLMTRGAGAILTAEEGAAVELVREARAAFSLSDSAGGYGVPVLIDPTIILTNQGHPNDFFQIARVEDITNDEWKGVSAAGATSYWTTEAVTFTGGEPTLAQPTVPTKKLTTTFKYSFEIGGDYPGFAAQTAMLMGESQSETLVSAFTNGLGTTAQPTGIITAIEAGGASFQVAVTTDGSFGAVDLYKLWDALPIRYRTNARWMASTSVSNSIRQFAAGSSNSDANFTINITQAEIERLFGKPFHYNDYMDDSVGTGGVTSASDVTLVVVGDFRNFLIANRVGATVETVQHVLDTTTGLPTGERMTFMWRRIGSDSINDAGFRILTQD
jgi:HK97 family phage major capsid protein